MKWVLIVVLLMLLYIGIIYFLVRWSSDNPKEFADLENIRPLFGSKLLGIIFSASWKVCIGFMLVVLALVVFGMLHGLLNELLHTLF